MTWKEAMEKKGLRVNAGKTKIMICGMGLDLLQFRRIFMRGLSHWSGQQQHLLQWLQALGAQEMQWANTCENRLEAVQGSATSSLFMPPLFQNTWPCVQLLCAEHNAPSQPDLAIDKAKPPASAAK